jgi:predicted tellurium resistance membrane protein TerC
VFIALGAAMLHRWHEITYVFGAILVVTAWRLVRVDHPGTTPARGPRPSLLPHQPSYDQHTTTSHHVGAANRISLSVASAA